MNIAIIVAAGRGTRMGANVDKLFLHVAGKTIIEHTWHRMDQIPEVDEIILVVRDGMQDDFEELAAKVKPTKPYLLVPGGKERQDSVWNGIKAAEGRAEIVLIHDGARPCITGDLVRATIKAARETGASVAAQPVTDTIKQSEDGQVISGHPERSRLWAVQTPQTFRTDVILNALGKVREQGLQVTDDTAACELIGQPVRLVSDPHPNPKATAPSDLPYLELLLAEG